MFTPTPGTKEFRDALSPVKTFLYECKKSKRIETYKFSFQPVEGELGVQVGVRKTAKPYQFLSLKSSALMSPNAAKEIYFKLISNWFGNANMPNVRQAYDAQVAKLASPPPARPAPAAASAPGGSTGGSQVAPDPAPAPSSAPAPESDPAPAPQSPATCWNEQNEEDASPTADVDMDTMNEGREEGELNELDFPPLGDAKKRGRGSNSSNTPTKKQVEKKRREAKSKSQSGSGSD